MSKFIIRRVETIEVEAKDRYEAGKIAMLFSHSKANETLSVDYYYDSDGPYIEDLYELVV